MEAFLISTGVVALAEIGDKTQLLALVLAARFRKPVGPGDQLLIEITFLTVRRNIWKFSGTSHVGDILVASADFLTTVSEPGA